MFQIAYISFDLKKNIYIFASPYFAIIVVVETVLGEIVQGVLFTGEMSSYPLFHPTHTSFDTRVSFTESRSISVNLFSQNKYIVPENTGIYIKFKFI